MATIRELQRDDLPEVSRLFLELTPEAHWSSAEACAGYLAELLFDSPWADLDVPSWVAVDAGRIVAFYLLMPRRLRFGDRVLRAAIGCQMSVAEDYRRSLVALELAKRALTGPQDLTIADGAHEKSRDMWRALGGQVPLVYNLHWIRPLKPARALLAALAARKVLPRAALLPLAPLAAAFDAASLRLRWNRALRQPPQATTEPLDARLLAEALPTIVRDPLRPDYDPASLEWLLRQTLAKTGAGGLRALAVRRPDGRLLGWFVYQLRRGGTSEVIQVAAREADLDTVFQSLLHDAGREGAAALRGRGERRHIETLSAHHCWFRREGKCALLHSRHADIRAAIDDGRSFLSRWEGEWWLRHVTA